MQIGKQNWPYIDKSLGFNIPEFDTIDLSYTGDDLTMVTYKKLNVTVAKLELLYVNNKLTTVQQII